MGETKKIMTENHEMTEEVMRKLLMEIGEAVGIKWPESSQGAFFFQRQVTERVRRATKQAQLYDKLIEPLKAAIIGR
jgi:hypothetical protein